MTLSKIEQLEKRGRATTKIHLAVDVSKHPIDFEIAGGKSPR